MWLYVWKLADQPPAYERFSRIVANKLCAYSTICNILSWFMRFTSRKSVIGTYLRQTYIQAHIHMYISTYRLYITWSPIHVYIYIYIFVYK